MIPHAQDRLQDRLQRDNPPAVPRCICGHLRGDHRTGGSRWPAPLTFGVCQVQGCHCSVFEDQALHTVVPVKGRLYGVCPSCEGTDDAA